MRHVMSTTTDTESYEIVFVALKDATPADVRLQALLKIAKRRFAFCCKSVKPAELKKQRVVKAKKTNRVGTARSINAEQRQVSGRS